MPFLNGNPPMACTRLGQMVWGDMLLSLLDLVLPSPFRPGKLLPGTEVEWELDLGFGLLEEVNEGVVGPAVFGGVAAHCVGPRHPRAVSAFSQQLIYCLGKDFSTVIFI